MVKMIDEILKASFKPLQYFTYSTEINGGK